MARLLFFADSHLTNTVWKHKPEISGDAYFAFEQIINFALKNKPDAVLCGGDIFDSSNPSDIEVKQLFNLLVKLSSQNPNLDNSIPFMYIKGNHDNNPGEGWPSVAGLSLNNIINVSNNLIELGNTRILSFNHMPRSQLLDTLPSIPDDVNVVMLHTCLKEALGFEESYEIKLSELPAGKVPRVYLLGDIHKPYSHIDNKNKLQVYYPGSTHALDVLQSHTKQFLEVNIGLTGEIQVNPYTLLSRPMFSYELRDEDAINKFLQSTVKKIKSEISKLQETLPEKFLKPIVYVKFYPVLNAYTKLMEALSPIAFPFLNPITIQNKAIELLVKETKPVNINTIIKTIMQEQFDTTISSLTEELLSAENADVVLNNYEERFLNATS